jgi:hypothetical protein
VQKPAQQKVVERAHQTLQDRRSKELRLQGISSMEAANICRRVHERLQPTFLKSASPEFDVHRELDVDDDLDMVFNLA